MTIGQRLKYLRKKANLTQQELCNLIGLEQATYSRYERDIISPNSYILVHICKALNASADFILGLTDNPTPHKEILDLKEMIDPDLELKYEDIKIDKKTKKILLDTIIYVFDIVKEINKED